MVDPSAEVSVIKDRLRLGLITPDDALREMGYTDPDDVLTRYAATCRRWMNSGWSSTTTRARSPTGARRKPNRRGAIPSKHLKRLQKMTEMTQTHETPMLSLRARCGRAPSISRTEPLN